MQSDMTGTPVSIMHVTLPKQVLTIRTPQLRPGPNESNTPAADLTTGISLTHWRQQSGTLGESLGCEHKLAQETRRGHTPDRLDRCRTATTRLSTEHKLARGTRHSRTTDGLDRHSTSLTSCSTAHKLEQPVIATRMTDDTQCPSTRWYPSGSSEDICSSKTQEHDR